MYNQQYYVVGGIKIAPTNPRYHKIKEEDRLSERFASYSTTTKQIEEAYRDYLDSMNY